MKQLRLNINAETKKDILVALRELILIIDDAVTIQHDNIVNACGHTENGEDFDFDISDVAEDESVFLSNRSL